MKEVIKLEIESIREKIKFYRNVFLALLIGIVSSVYNLFSQNSENIKLYGMLYFGVFVVVGLFIKLKILDDEEQSLIDKYERIENDNI